MEIIFFITLLSYSIVVAQSFSYIISLRNVHESLDAVGYIVVRKHTDRNFRAKFKWVFYATLICTTGLCVAAAIEGNKFVLICSAIAWIAFVLDTVFMMKGNMPINNLINTWKEDDYPADWESYRKKWLDAFAKRQVANITGFISLLVAAVFG